VFAVMVTLALSVSVSDCRPASRACTRLVHLLLVRRSSANLHDITETSSSSRGLLSNCAQCEVRQITHHHAMSSRGRYVPSGASFDRPRHLTLTLMSSDLC
jgi:hypothetical protein